MTYKTIKRTPWVLKYPLNTVRLIESAPPTPPEFAHFKHVFWFQEDGQEPFCLALHPDGRYAINTPHSCKEGNNSTFRIITFDVPARTEEDEAQPSKSDTKICLQYKGSSAPLLEVSGWLLDIPQPNYQVWEEEAPPAETTTKPTVALVYLDADNKQKKLSLRPTGQIICIHPHNGWPISQGWIAYFLQNEKNYKMPKSASIRLKPPQV